MKKSMIAFCVVMSAGFTSQASALCTTTGSYTSCYDSRTGTTSGSTRIGNQTFTNGYSSKLNSSFTETSNHIGNQTYRNGRTSNGSATWNSTSNRIGNQTFTNGTIYFQD